MAKSVLDIEVNDGEFKQFEAAFEKYNTQLAKSPSAWSAITKENKQVETAFRSMTAALLAQGEVLRKNSREQKLLSDHARNTATSWERISGHAKSFATSVASAAGNLLKSAGVIGGIGALAGLGGGLWGLGHLAHSAGAGRRSATGLGLSYGEQQAFGLTYGRLVDTGSFLGGVSQARGNIASPAATALYTLGINPSAGGSAGQTAADALSRIRSLTQSTPDNQLGILTQTHQLGELGLTTEDLRRIKGLSNSEFSEYSRDYATRRGQLGVDDPTLKKWQDLGVQLDTAGQRIKNVLIDGLAPLAPGLTQLSDGLANVVKSLLGSQGFKDAIVWMSRFLNDFAGYVQKDEFKRDLRDLVNGIGSLASAVGDALRLLGILPSNAGAGGAAAAPPVPSREEWNRQTEQGLVGQTNPVVAERYRRRRAEDYDRMVRERGSVTPNVGGAPAGVTQNGQSFLGGIVGTTSVNNPGNLRGPGGTGFLQYNDPNAGLTAASNNLLYYQDKEGRDTIRKIIERWAPSSENDTAAYIRNVSNWTKFGPDQKLDLHDAKTRAEVLSAITRQEGSKHYYSPGAVKVVIENNTGGNANVSTSQMGFPQ